MLGAAMSDGYIEIAAALKAEAGVRQHTEHKRMNGQAWMDTGHILAPTGTTRRQLYMRPYRPAFGAHDGEQATTRQGA
jgi:hypothetical protein